MFYSIQRIQKLSFEVNFLKQKWTSVTKVTEVLPINLEQLQVVQLDIFWKIVCASLSRQPTKLVLKRKNMNIYYFRFPFFYSKNGLVPPKYFKCFRSMWNFQTLFTYFLDMSACVSVKVVSKNPSGCKISWKIRNFEVSFLKQKQKSVNKVIKYFVMKLVHSFLFSYIIPGIGRFSL